MASLRLSYRYWLRLSKVSNRFNVQSTVWRNITDAKLTNPAILPPFDFICYLRNCILRMRFFGKIWKRIIDPRSLGSRCIKGIEEYFPRVNLSVFFEAPWSKWSVFGFFKCSVFSKWSVFGFSQRNAPKVENNSAALSTLACLHHFKHLRNFLNSLGNACKQRWVTRSTETDPINFLMDRNRYRSLGTSCRFR